MLCHLLDWHKIRALPCYRACSDAWVPVLAPESLIERLSSAAGSKDRFGATASEVLGTGSLIAAADQEWDKNAVLAFQDQERIHPKVWGKLVAIYMDKRLVPLQEHLPASYTALYALVVMSDGELSAAVSEGIVNVHSSSRVLLDWTKAYRLRGTGIEQEMPFTLVLREELSAKQHQDLMEALQQVAAGYGTEVREGKRGIKQAEVKAESRKVLAAQIEEELMREIGEVVAAAPETLKEQFQVRNALDLITGPREQLTGFLQVLGNRVQETFWRDYGRAYCLKIARDFNVTDSRTDRYQFKKRLTDAKKKWALEIDGFGVLVDDVMRTYMGK